MRIISALISIFSIVVSCEGTLEPIFYQCCRAGRNWGIEGKDCSKFPAPVKSVVAEQQGLCLSAVDICCTKIQRDKKCEAGKKSARIGRDCLDDGTPGAEYSKDCCEACKLGLITGTLGDNCKLKDFSFGFPWDDAYINCCLEKISSSRPAGKQTTPLLNTESDADDDMCAKFPGELCAHICIPTIGSYICECNAGFTLESDGRQCVKSGKTDRCQTNNPCAHKCLDTGEAIECSCHPGFQLGPDERSCLDVDECLLNIDTCTRLTQFCQNKIGSFLCVSKDTGEIASNAIDAGDSKDRKRKCPRGFKFNEGSKTCDDIDECLEEIGICTLLETCENTIGSFKCLSGPGLAALGCPDGFRFDSGVAVCLDIDECLENNPCNKEKETCVNTVGAYVCQDKSLPHRCPAGFKFSLVTYECEDVNECEENIHTCDPEKEKCRNTVGAYDCDTLCQLGYYYDETRRTCIDVNECLSKKHKCDASQLCINTIGSYTCEEQKNCPVGLEYDITSDDCIDVNECLDKTICGRSKTCINVYGSYKCVQKHFGCPKGYQYNALERSCTDIDECKHTPSVCGANELCINDQGSYRCEVVKSGGGGGFECPTGYLYNQGTNSCLDIDECLLSPCSSDEECLNSIGSFSCVCLKGYSFNRRLKICEDINECGLEIHDCNPSQRCDNTIGSFACVRITSCGTGYTFNSETNQCDDNDECEMGISNCHLLGPTFECRNTQGSFRCEKKSCPYGEILRDDGQCDPLQCGPGYKVGDKACADINECLEANPCKKTERCINSRGSYHCENILKCGVGFELSDDGSHCVDVDECTTRAHTCNPDQECLNMPGTYGCKCQSGFQMNENKECRDIDECQEYSGRLCSHYSKCVNTFGSFKCDCNAGFTQATDKRTCVDVDECETPGICHHKCINIWSSYRCACDSGYRLGSDQRSCIDVNECQEIGSSKLCVGNCVNTPGSYNCACPPGYRLGRDKRICQDIEECSEQNVCQGENEFCVNTRGGYKCERIICPTGYVHDGPHKNRCKRKIPCQIGDEVCIQSPSTYNYNYVTFTSNLKPTSGSDIELFTMRGPTWSSTHADFQLELKEVRAPSDVTAVTRSYFSLRESGFNQAAVYLIKTIPGPQEIELELLMRLLHKGVYSGSAVAKLFIYVSRYEY